jgi:hypothetical protein
MIQETVDTDRGLADANPGRYRADLANSLSNLGFLYSALGRSIPGVSAPTLGAR